MLLTGVFKKLIKEIKEKNIYYINYRKIINNINFHLFNKNIFILNFLINVLRPLIIIFHEII